MMVYLNKYNIFNKNDLYIFFNKYKKLSSDQKKIDGNTSRNISSLLALKRIKNNYYNFNDKLLPKIKNIYIYEDFEIINKHITDKHLINIHIMLQFYIIFDKYVNQLERDNPKQSSFMKFIEYNKNIYSKNFYDINQFYNKVKRCYDFISIFKKKGLDNKQIIELLYKSKINYSSLYRIKGHDYEKLKTFFIDKITLVKENPDNNIKINNIIVKYKPKNVNTIT